MKIPKLLLTNVFLPGISQSLRTKLQNNHIHPLKFKIDGLIKLKSPKNKKEIHNYIGIFSFLRPLYLQLRDTVDLNGLQNFDRHLTELKRNLRMVHSLSQFLIQKDTFIFYAMPQTMALKLHYSKKQFGKMELVSANSRLFSTRELRLSIILCECSATIYALSDYRFLIKGSQHFIILYTDHKPILILFPQKNKPNHRV